MSVFWTNVNWNLQLPKRWCLNHTIVTVWARAFSLPLIAVALCLPCMADQRASSSQASGDGNGTAEATELACNALIAQAAQALAAGRRYDAEMALRRGVEPACHMRARAKKRGGCLRACHVRRGTLFNGISSRS